MTDRDFQQLWSKPVATLTPEEEAELATITAEIERIEAACPNRAKHATPHLLGEDGCEHCGFYGK